VRRPRCRCRPPNGSPWRPLRRARSSSGARFLERRPGRPAGEERVVIATDDGRPACAPGRTWWSPSRRSSRGSPARWGEGASLIVGYEGDNTERALRRRAPPAATPLGLVLLRAGCAGSRTGTSPRVVARAAPSCRAPCRWMSSGATRLKGSWPPSCAPSWTGTTCSRLMPRVHGRRSACWEASVRRPVSRRGRATRMFQTRPAVRTSGR
jgi:hypothetical protein